MTSALLSLARNQAPRTGVVMTGEITLTGRVLPVGGIREKVIAARRQSIFELILPEANRGDYEELPTDLKEAMTLHFASRYEDVAKVLFVCTKVAAMPPSLALATTLQATTV